MPQAASVDREVYRPSGRWRPVTLLWGGLMVTGAGLLVSAALALCSYYGFYFLILMPMLGGLLAGLLGILVVRQAHCRNRLLAGLLGLMIGVVAYLGNYHVDMLRFIGFDNWHRVDALPHYIWFRWQVDTVGKPGQNHGPPWWVMNMIISIVEVGCMGGISASLAWGAAGKPYAEGAGCWMTNKTAQCPAGASAAIVAALDQHSSESLQAAVQPMFSDTDGYCQLEVWMCPRHRDPERDEPMLLTVSEFGPANKDGQRKSAAVARLWTIEPAEMVILARQLPVLATWLQEDAARAGGADLAVEAV